MQITSEEKEKFCLLAGLDPKIWGHDVRCRLTNKFLVVEFLIHAGFATDLRVASFELKKVK